MKPWLQTALGPKYLLSWLIAIWCGTFSVLALFALDDPANDPVAVIVWAVLVAIMGVAGAFAAASVARAAHGSKRLRAAVLGSLGAYAAGTVLTMSSGVVGLVNMLFALVIMVQYIRAVTRGPQPAPTTTEPDARL